MSDEETKPETEAKPKPNETPNATKKAQLTDKEWKLVPIHLETLARTGQRTDLLRRAAKEDGARYAKLNGEIMKPIREEIAERQEAAKAESKKHAQDLADRNAARAAQAEDRIAERAAQKLAGMLKTDA